MNLADARLKGLDNPALTASERVLLRCMGAADLINCGQYETAREALGELWRGIGERPNVEGLDERTAAEVLLQCGALSGWIGASGQVADAQTKAKDLISESAAIFERVGEVARAAIAQSDLALCYWREGAYDEARVVMTRAVDGISGADAELRMIVLLRCVTIECAAGRFVNALDILKGSAHALDESTNHALRGSFHNLYAVTLRHLGSVEGQGHYYDKAILEYTAAIFHYERAGHERYRANNENNLAFLLYKLGRYEQAHEHLDRAGATLARLNDVGLLAQVDETRAHVLIAEQKYREANKVIGSVIQTLERGGESALLAYAFEVQGIVWARLGAYESSVNILRHAVTLARDAGALSNAALIALTLIEEHGAHRLPEGELFKLYLRADELLKGSQDYEETARLRACARILIQRVTGLGLRGRDFSLHDAVHELEATYIGQALDEAGGSVTKAAGLLGISHQLLTTILNTRHRKLQKKRTPPKKRGRSIFKKPQ